MLARPAGAPSLQEVISAAVGSSTEQDGGLAGWQRLAGFSQEGTAQWEVLDSQRAVALQKSLMQFAKLACCHYLCPKVELPSDWSSDGGVDEQETPAEGIVLLDANGGQVSVLQQSWKEMMQQKLKEGQ